MLIRAAALDDWALVKEARLRALADSPAAFGSTWAREATFGDDEWQRRVAPGIWLLAVDDERVVGMNALIAEADSPTEERHLVAMWVEPGHRGSQAATLLIEAACAQARDAGATAVTLWVADPNTRARRFYERVGFQSTGRRAQLSSNPAIGEEELRRVIGA
jgi:ribosomal protein S18 acetylase RimI-like enzyme